MTRREDDKAPDAVFRQMMPSRPSSLFAAPPRRRAGIWWHRSASFCLLLAIAPAARAQSAQDLINQMRALKYRDWGVGRTSQRGGAGTASTPEYQAVQENEAGVACAKAGNWAEAVEHYRRAFQLNPRDEIIRNNLAESLHNLAVTADYSSANWATALSLFQEALALLPDDRSCREDVAWCQGRIAFQNKDFAGALDRFREALACEPANAALRENVADAENNLGAASADRGDLAAAAAYYEQALSDCPQVANAAANLAAVRKIQAENTTVTGMQQLIQAVQPASTTPVGNGGQSPLAFGSDVVDLRGAGTTAVDPARVMGLPDASVTASSQPAGSSGDSPKPGSETVAGVPAKGYRPPRTVAEAQQRLAVLDRQIDETRKQLQSLGFAQRSQDFDQVGKLSSDEVGEIKSQVRQLEEGLGQDLGQEAMLSRLEKLNPATVQKAIDALGEAGVQDPRLLQALADFKGSAPREELLKDARFVLDRINQSCDMNEISDKLSSDGKREQREAGLMLVTLFSGSSVAQAIYDSGDAWLTYGILRSSQEGLDQVTDRQLGDLNTIIARRKTLIDDRNRLRGDLQELQHHAPPSPGTPSNPG